jgi:hypothetical protein
MRGLCLSQMAVAANGSPVTYDAVATALQVSRTIMAVSDAAATPSAPSVASCLSHVMCSLILSTLCHVLTYVVDVVRCRSCQAMPLRLQ